MKRLLALALAVGFAFGMELNQVDVLDQGANVRLKREVIT